MGLTLTARSHATSELQTLNNYVQGRRHLRCKVCMCAPILSFNQKFQKLLIETETTKIGRYLAELGNYNQFEFFWKIRKSGLQENFCPHLHLLLHKVAPKFAVSKFVVIFWAPKTANLEDLVYPRNWEKLQISKKFLSTSSRDSS